MNEKKDVLAVKAGLWYTVSNFIIRSLSIISTPIFTRVMTRGEYGDFSNYAAWVTLITVLASLDLHSTLNRARFDYADDFDGYISSITVTSLVIPSVLYLIVIIFSDFFMGFLNMDIFCIHCMFLSVIFSSALNIYQTKQRVFYKYKLSVFITFLSSVLTVGGSLLLVLLMSDKLYGRILGQTIPAVIINIVLAAYLILKGRKIKLSYIKYAVLICLPYIPHLLALNILSQYDRIQIKEFCGETEVAFYSLAYSCAIIINIFLNSMNNAWSPWLGDMLKTHEYGRIRETSKKYIMLFAFIAVGIFIIAPELLMIFGGEDYSEAIYIMPPVIAGSVFQFIYTLYVNVEMFEKKVWGVAGATSIAAAVNIILNYLLIPQFGYIAAAFTTLFCYGLLCLLHYILVRRMKLSTVYDTKFIIAVLAAVTAVLFLMYPVYNMLIVRLIIIVLYGAAWIAVAVKNRKLIKKLLKKGG